jgi:hypothetical protein
MRAPQDCDGPVRSADVKIASPKQSKEPRHEAIAPAPELSRYQPEYEGG